MEKLVENRGLSHLALHIFSFLDFRRHPYDFNNCRLVCKAWQTVIDTSLFYWQERLSFYLVKKVIMKRHWEEFDVAFQSVVNHKVWKDVRDFALLLEEYLDEEYDYCIENDLLHHYCHQGNNKAVSLLMKFYTNLDAKKYTTQMTPLIVACSLGHIDIVNLFLDVDLDVVKINYNMRDDKNYTALHHACKAGHTRVVKLLSEKSEERQINLHAVSDENMNVFGWSIWSRKDDLLDFIINNLEKHSIATDGLINGFNIRGGTLFIIACWRKNLKAVTYIVENSKELGIDLNQKDQGGGRSGFYVACLNGCVEIVKLLAENSASKGINIQEPVDSNRNALAIAASFNRVSVVKYILSHLEMFKCNVHEAFRTACMEDIIDVAKVILETADTLEEKKSMLTFQTNLGKNAVMLTMIGRDGRNSSYRTLRYLLEQMVQLGIPLSDRSHEDHYAMSAFDMICVFGDINAMIAYMQAIENHVDYEDHNGETGFIKACKYNRHEIVEHIIKSKAYHYFNTLDLNATDNEWMTGFMWACKLRCAKVVEVILKHAKRSDIDLIASDKQGRTGYDLWPKKISFPTTEEYQNKRHIYCNIGPNWADRFLDFEHSFHPNLLF